MEHTLAEQLENYILSLQEDPEKIDSSIANYRHIYDTLKRENTEHHLGINIQLLSITSEKGGIFIPNKDTLSWKPSHVILVIGAFVCDLHDACTIMPLAYYKQELSYYNQCRLSATSIN